MSPLISIHPQLKFMHDIASSAEYQYASSMRSKAKWSTISIVLYRIPFFILLVLQLDKGREWNWNVVFAPIWIEVLINTLSSCWSACCGGSAVCVDLSETGVQHPTTTGRNRRYKDDDDDDDEELEEEEENEKYDKEKGDLVEEMKCSKKNENSTTNVIESMDTDNIEPKQSAYHSSKSKNDQEETKQQSDDIQGNNRESQSTPGAPLQSSNRHESVSSSDVEINDYHYASNNTTGRTGGHDYTQFDSGQVETFAKSQVSCCYYILVVTGLSLFMVTLNCGTDVSHEDLDYSSFWVLLVPMFLVALRHRRALA